MTPAGGRIPRRIAVFVEIAAELDIPGTLRATGEADARVAR
ncbi:MAG: hypothetical protein ABW215_21490 [Kibdelosporangium sp.]